MNTELDDVKHELKRHQLFLEWTKQAIDYFQRESRKNAWPEYERGQVLWVDLGFNVGSELGGDRPAIVLLTSRATNNKVFVLPLTSQEPKTVFAHHLQFGKLPGLWKDSEWASVYEVRYVSKLRTRLASDIHVSGDALDAISEKIAKMICLRDS